MNKLSSRTEKIHFLSLHPELWNEPHKVIREKLIEAGLVRPSTYVFDLRLNDMLKEAKRLERAR